MRITRSLIAALAIILAGCGSQEDVSPSFEDRIPLGLELKAADKLLAWGESTTLTGRLTQEGDTLAGETVVLEADPYPFARDYAELDSVATDDKGRFEFETQPDANTAFRVASGDLSETTSREVRVYVDPRTEVQTEPAGNGTRFTTVFHHPDERSIQGSNVFSYAATAADAEATGKLRFIQVDRVEQKRLGLSTAAITLPFAPEQVRHSACYSYTPSSGMGAPNANCVQSEIPAE